MASSPAAAFDTVAAKRRGLAPAGPSAARRRREDEGRVHAGEARRGRHGSLGRMTTRLAVHQVEAGTGGIDGGETDRRGDEPLRQHLETEDSLEGTGRAERVADRSLDRVDGDIA